MAFGRLLVILIVIIAPTMAWGARTLKPQDVVDSVLGKSIKADFIRLDSQEYYIEKERALGLYDFNLKGDLGYEYREAENLSGLSNPIDKTLTANLALTKKTSVGASLEFGYLHQTQSSVLNAIITTREPTLTLDAAYFQWRQNFWANALGVSDRLSLAIAQRRFQSGDLHKQEQTENLVLQSLKAFWQTYVAQTTLKDSITARKMYQDLIKVVQKRGRFGLDKGGEYAQVMADYTTADNAVKTASYLYISRLKDLERLMQEPFNEEDIEFHVEALVPPLPKYDPVKNENLRTIKIAEINLQNAQASSRALDWRNHPSLDLVARATSTGVDTRAHTAYAELVAGNKPTYYVGLEFSTPLDSSSSRASAAEARVHLERAQATFKDLVQDHERKLYLLERRLEQTYLNANGAIEIEKYQSRTVREQENEYRQGRLPLRDLLETYRRFFNTQTQRVQAIGDYHFALNEMAAERDELVR